MWNKIYMYQIYIMHTYILAYQITIVSLFQIYLYLSIYIHDWTVLGDQKITKIEGKIAYTNLIYIILIYYKFYKFFIFQYRYNISTFFYIISQKIHYLS